MDVVTEPLALRKVLDELLESRPSEGFTYLDPTGGLVTEIDLEPWSTPLWDARKALDNLHVIVLRSLEGGDRRGLNESTAGFSTKKFGADFVWLNACTPRELKPRVMAHELGHIVLGHTAMSFDPLQLAQSYFERYVGEIEAESVAGVVASQILPESSLVTWHSSISYINEYRTNIQREFSSPLQPMPEAVKVRVIDAATKIIKAGLR